VPFFDDIEQAGLTDVGMRRSHNQDALTSLPAMDRVHWRREGHLFIVADGMGGHAVGEMASNRAVREIPLIYAKHVETEGPELALRRAFLETNLGIYTIGQRNPEFAGLGTTAVALVLREEGAWLGHVGDSRIYRIRDGQIEQLTYDHSFAWEMAKRMNVDPDSLPDVKKNVIVRSLGPDPLVQVDIEGPHPLLTGDTFILCSDGLSNVVQPEEIGTIATVLSPEEASKSLIELANLRGGPDNISAIVVRIGAGQPSMMLRGAPTRGIPKLMKNMAKPFGRIPWPIAVLGTGFLLAVLCVVLLMNQEKGIAGLLFALSLVSIIVGMVGLYRQQQQAIDNPPPPPEKPRSLNVYRTFACRIEKEHSEKLGKMAEVILTNLKEENPQYDEREYRKIRKRVDEALNDGDVLVSFREQCRAMTLLARQWNTSRPRNEGGFKPKYDG
jgi:PPM family protein phosphatase